MCSVLLAAGKLVRSDLKYHLVPQMSGLRSATEVELNLVQYQSCLFPGSGPISSSIQNAPAVPLEIRRESIISKLQYVVVCFIAKQITSM